MASISELHDRTRILLCRKPDDATPAQGGAASLDEADAPIGTFQFFLPSHQERAMAAVAQLMKTARDHEGNAALEAVLDKAEGMVGTEDMELVRFALLAFITHDPEGRRLPIPPMAERVPEVVVPSRKRVAAADLGDDESFGGLGEEALLDYFREDTGFNDHHMKWHIVNQAGGIPNPTDPFGPRLTKDRQGELFWYMHQQMLARYDTERRANGLAPTQPLTDYRAAIPEGYDANLPGFSNRRPDETMGDFVRPGFRYTVADHEERRDRHQQAALDGFYRVDGQMVAMTPDRVGATVEANLSSVEGDDWSNPLSFYGNQHNFGHVLLADLADPAGPNPTRPGVMTSPATAVRDPVFFRWHRHVDDLFFAWQDRLPESDFATGAPPVLIRPDRDLILCKTADVPGADQDDFDGATFGEATFGGTAWEDDPNQSGFTTNELVTTLETELLPGDVPKPYLDHEDFLYFFRLENQSDTAQDVTVRLFLAAAELADDRRWWIEMDKFAQHLPANARQVVYRSARQSSVVRKPARHPHEPIPQLPPGAVDRNYCDCGWPYHLLLPRGQEVGMPYRLLVMLTNGEDDLVGAERKCGSMSFCGARDAEYPDSKPMGYPFDRPFTTHSIAETVAAQDNWATRDLVIRHVP